MPTRTKAKSKKKALRSLRSGQATKVVRKMARAAVKKAAKKIMRKKSKAVTVKKKSMKKTVKKKASSPKISIIGEVVHYYDKISVAIVELAKPLKVGDTVLIKRGEHELTQPVESMQIEHEPVTSAKKGQVIGLKVDAEVASHSLVLPV